MKTGIILGTRPEIIKMSPLIRALEKRHDDYFILHTGQHYSYTLDKIFFKELELPFPKQNLDVGSGSHAEETGRMLAGIEQVLQKESPDVVLVEGDTNTVLAGGLAASKMHIKVGHVEAGLRSNDRSMPEEINRILTDHISDYLFAPTRSAQKNLLKEGFENNTIFVTGNTIVDAVYQNLAIARKKNNIFDSLKISPKKYILLTAHRQENVDDKKKLRNIINGVQTLSREHVVPVIYPVHPRTTKRMKEFKITVPREITMIEPLGFLEFLQLESQAMLVVTDSGGVQEETCILQVPCITLRENTERPETLEVGSNMLVGTDLQRIVKGSRAMVRRKRSWKVPFGDGTAGKKIINILEKKLR